MKKPWFKAKKYGIGWGLPVKWEGWVVFLSYMIFLIWDFQRIDRHALSASDTLRPYIFQIIAASIVFVGIVSLTGEKLKWRWGENTEKKENVKKR